jgi:hypothetical protein
MKKTFIAIFFLAFSSISQAGFNGLTMHSRANCGNNESISWDATRIWRLGTNSTHSTNLESHTFGTGIHNTHRSAAVHWGEGTGGWMVYGQHFVFDDHSNKINEYIITIVFDCSIYDGWWDWKP